MRGGGVSAVSDAPITVTLGTEELRFAAMIGIARQIENVIKGRLDAHGADKDRGWQIHIEGAAGEAAFAKWADRYWSGNLGDLRAHDVGRVEVRTAARPDSHLLLHPSDPDDARFVLVTGRAPTYALRGWIWGRDGKQQPFWRDPVGGRPAFFVPQSALRPMVRRASDMGEAA